MSANLLYVTDNTLRIEAFRLICAEENYTLTICQHANVDRAANYDLILYDALSKMNFDNSWANVPVLAVYDPTHSTEADLAFASTALDVLAFPFEAVETASRLRCLSRLHMLQEELNHINMPEHQGKAEAVLVIGPALPCFEVKKALGQTFEVECIDDDITGLLRAGQGQWSCIILALGDVSRNPASLIRQIRSLNGIRTTSVLVYAETADKRCVEALLAGANDMALAAGNSAELTKRVWALAHRKSVLDTLKAQATLIAPLSDFDRVTGLPGPSQLMRTLATSLKRLEAQGKPASLLLIAVDPPAGVPEGETVPDTVMLALTQVLRRSLRGFDYACRFGSDSFAILMPGADATSAEQVAKRICAEIKAEKVRVKDTRKDGTTASIGLATMAAPGQPVLAKDMIATAADSLVKAQTLGAAQIISQQLRLAA